jgi:hypothetical protein
LQSADADHEENRAAGGLYYNRRPVTIQYMETIQEIARILRSTDNMAEGFAQRVREMVGSDVPEETILQAMKRLNPRALDINKVAVAVKAEVNRVQRRAGRASRATVARPGRPEQVLPAATPVEPQREESAAPNRTGTMMGQLEQILEANWQRAEREGLEPPRMSGAAFVDAVHRHSDPRDATRRRIVKACKTAEGRDVLITPTLVADMIREAT